MKLIIVLALVLGFSALSDDKPVRLIPERVSDEQLAKAVGMAGNTYESMHFYDLYLAAQGKLLADEFRQRDAISIANENNSIHQRNLEISKINSKAVTPLDLEKSEYDSTSSSLDEQIIELAVEGDKYEVLIASKQNLAKNGVKEDLPGIRMDSYGLWYFRTEEAKLKRAQAHAALKFYTNKLAREKDLRKQGAISVEDFQHTKIERYKALHQVALWEKSVPLLEEVRDGFLPEDAQKPVK